MTITNDSIIQLRASGYSVKEIANMLGMKTRTTEKRLERLKQKHDCKNDIQLVVKYLRLLPENMQPV